MKKRLVSLAAVVLSLSLLLAACETGSSAPTQAPDTGSPATSLPSGEDASAADPKVLLSWTTDRQTFSPHMYTSGPSIAIYGSWVALMVSMDGTETLEFKPHHASELPSSEDGLTWTVKIRDDLTWDDGKKLDANDYYYSMQQLLNPKLANKNAAYMFDPCKVLNAAEYYAGECEWDEVGVKLIDDNTLEITLEFAATELDFWTSLGGKIWPVHQEIYEKNMNADETSTSYGTSFETTPSCGMFLLKEWISGGHETYVRNDNDPLVKEGYILIDEYNLRYISENSTREEMFLKGELDQHSLTGATYNQYKNDPRAHATLSSSVWGLFVNGASKNEIMRDKDFRQALYYAAPRDEVAEEVYVLYLSAPFIVSTAIMVGDPLVSTEYYRDTDAAKALMETYHNDDELAVELFNKAYEANGSKKISVEITYFDQQEQMKRTAEVMQEKCENLFGSDKIEFTLRAQIPQAAYDDYRNGEYDLGTGVRLANVFNPWASMNVWTSDYADKYETGFASEEFDELYHKTVFGEYMHDADNRVKSLARMEELLLEYVAFIPLMQNNNTVMYAERVELPSESYLPFVGYGFSQSDLIPQ